ncbi:hypothetical protein AWV79_22415 [Cupriavidus sp. UYMMa02A]|nr:hypothetical protein AWV79_22415 [Cupriavidus sp. UYMMa02A]
MNAAQDLLAALWESGFCTNDMTQRGSPISPDVVEKGLIATFALKPDNKVLDLDGTVLSMLGQQLFVERQTPFVMPVKIAGKDTETVVKALIRHAC